MSIELRDGSINKRKLGKNCVGFNQLSWPLYLWLLSGWIIAAVALGLELGWF